MPSWNHLPFEMKEMVVQRSTENTRNALKSCSSSSKDVVAATKLNIIYHLDISKNPYNGKGSINTIRSRFLLPFTEKESKVFEEIQEKLTETLKPVQCIKSLTISPLPFVNEIYIELQDDEKPRILVENLCHEVRCSAKNVLSQIEPGYLRKVKIFSNGEDSDIYEMPQMVLAESVTVTGTSSISEEQLLKLNACEVSFSKISCSVHEYIKRCALRAGTTMPRFKFTASSFSDIGLSTMIPECSCNRIRLETPHPQLKLELKFGEVESSSEVFVEGGVRYESESCSLTFSRAGYHPVRVIEKLEVSLNDVDNKKITVQRQFYGRIEHIFKTQEEFQEKLDDIIEHADIIKRFDINAEKSLEKLNWKPRDVKLIIEHLEVLGNNSITSIENLLRQTDPEFKMIVKIEKNSEVANNMFLFDMPQIRNAFSVDIENPYLNDEKLLQMNTAMLRTGGPSCPERPVEPIPNNASLLTNNCITAKGINQLIKKSLGNSVIKEFQCTLGKVDENLNLKEMFEGLETTEYERANGLSEWIINTKDPILFFTVLMTSQKIIFFGIIQKCTCCFD